MAKKIEQMGMFDDLETKPISAPKPVQIEKKPEQAMLDTGEPRRKPSDDVAEYAEKAKSTDIRKHEKKVKVEIPPPGDSTSDETVFTNSLKTRLVSVSQVVSLLHAQNWLALDGGNIRLAYFSKIEEYRTLVSLLWPRDRELIMNTLEACRKEVEETERKLDLLIPVYEGNGKPEATGIIIEQLGQKQHRLHDQLGVLEPFSKLTLTTPITA